MAIAFARIHYITRSKGHSAVAAAAYRGGLKLYDERTGKTESYTNHSNHVVYSKILLPDGADKKFKDREFLWNQVEAAEDNYNTRRKDAQVAKDCILALPRDTTITRADQIELTRRFAHAHFVGKGVVVDMNIHDDNHGNPHAHLLITTRRLIGDQFDSHKARDLDPKILKGRVQLDRLNKLWGEEWRTIQNHYFDEKTLNLEVDPNGLVSQVHLGKHTFHHSHRQHMEHWQANEDRKSEMFRILLTDPEAVLNQITLHQATFTEADLARLIHIQMTKLGLDDPAKFQEVLVKTKSHASVMELGIGADGKHYYTTKFMFETENDIQQFADYLKKQQRHSVSTRVTEKKIAEWKLSDEQADAVRHVVDKTGIAAILGRAGTGKSYTLGVARDIWVQSGFRVLGVAVSGKAADSLKQNAGIESRTIASFRFALRSGRLKLSKNDVVVMDEAGMTDSIAFREILYACAMHGAKFVYAGDPDQTLPIGPGAPMRALLERTGYVELGDIRRQTVDWQRDATRHFAVGHINEAINLYYQNDCIHFAKTQDKTIELLISDWIKQYQDSGSSSVMIQAFTNEQVQKLNTAAREQLVQAGLLKAGIKVSTPAGERYFALGERIQFLKNDRRMGVLNGQFGTIEKWVRNKQGHLHALEVRIDGQPNQTVIIDLVEYDDIDYGYAATVNKLQGVTVNHSFGLYSGYGWNAHLAYVEKSRHRFSSHSYVDQSTYQNQCELILMDTAPRVSHVNKLPTVNDQVYVIANHKLYYVDKNQVGQARVALITLSDKQFRELSDFLNMDRLQVGKVKKLDVSQLDKIASITSHTHHDLTALKRTLRRKAPKDSVYDWPWHFRQRRGMPDTNGVVRQFKAHLAHRLKKATSHLRDQLEAQFSPEKYGDRIQRVARRDAEEKTQKQSYSDAVTVYNYTEAAKKSGQLWRKIQSYQMHYKDQFQTDFEAKKHPLYQEAHKAMMKRNALAAEIIDELPRYQKAVDLYTLENERLKTQAATHTGLETVKAYLEECQKQRPLYRDRLASKILTDGKRHALGMAYYELDWKTVREQARAHDRRVVLVGLNVEDRQRFYRVEKYIEAYKEAGKCWQRYLELKAKGVAAEGLSLLAEKARVTSLRRNELAATIYQYAKDYQIGLQFYHIEKDKKGKQAYAPFDSKQKKHDAIDVFAQRAIKLQKYAHQFFAHQRVTTFFNLFQEDPNLHKAQLGKLADTILRFPRFHNTAIWAISGQNKENSRDFRRLLWDAAIPYRRNRLYATLDDADKAALNQVEHLYHLNQSVREAWNDVYRDGKEIIAIKCACKITEQRDQLALLIYRYPEKYQQGLQLFHIKAESLQKSLQAEACRERVVTFLDPDIALSEKYKLAAFMASERRLHHAAVSHYQVDWRTIYPYADVIRHRERIQSLNIQARLDFKVLQRYALLRRRLARVIAHKKQQKIKWSPTQQQKFDRLQSERDSLAATILSDLNRYHLYLDDFRLDEKKMTPHAKRHTIQVTQLRHYLDERQKLMKALDGLMENVAPLHELAATQDQTFIQWRTQWQALSAYADQWIKKAAKHRHAFSVLNLNEQDLRSDCDLLKRLDQAIHLRLGRNIMYDNSSQSTVKLVQPTQTVGGQRRWNVQTIKEKLHDCAKTVAMAAVGSHEHFNAKLSNHHRLVWGQKNGSLHVAIGGAHVGKWNDFSGGGGGRDLLGFIAHQQGLSYRNAIEWAVDFLRLSDDLSIQSPLQKTVPQKTQQRTQQKSSFNPSELNRIDQARDIWKGTQPIQKTLAEKYLRTHRGIKTDLPKAYRFHPGVKNGGDGCYYPALIIGAKDKNGHIQFVQSIYLDKMTNNKITGNRKKQTNGVMPQSTVWLTDYRPGKPVLIAEGPETALSALEAKGQEWNVVCSMGSSNFKSIHLPKDVQDIIIAYDNDADNPKTEYLAKEAAKIYAARGINAWIIKPTKAGYDLNDLHLSKGIDAVCELLDQKIVYRKAVNAEEELSHIQDSVKAQAQQTPSTDADWRNEARHLVTVGQVDMAIDILEKQNLVHAEEDQAHTLAKILQDWQAKKTSAIDSAHMIAMTEADCTFLNENGHFLLKQDHQLTKLHELLTREGFKEFGVGETIRFVEAWEKKKVAENALAQILDVKGDKLQVQLEDHRKLTFKLSQYRSFDYGYALMPEYSKGKTFARGFVYAVGPMNKEQLKTALIQADQIDLYYSKQIFSESFDFKNQFNYDPELASTGNQKQEAKPRSRFQLKDFEPN